MKFTKNPNAPDNEKMQTVVARIAAGELSREQASTELGIPFSTFSTYLRRGGFLEQLRHTRRNTGEHNANYDPEKAPAYAEALADVLKANAERGSITRAAKKHGVNTIVLGRKVRKALGTA